LYLKNIKLLLRIKSVIILSYFCVWDNKYENANILVILTTRCEQQKIEIKMFALKSLERLLMSSKTFLWWKPQKCGEKTMKSLPR
jgi:hypothetical protein